MQVINISENIPRHPYLQVVLPSICRYLSALLSLEQFSQWSGTARRGSQAGWGVSSCWRYKPGTSECQIQFPPLPLPVCALVQVIWSLWASVLSLLNETAKLSCQMKYHENKYDKQCKHSDILTYIDVFKFKHLGQPNKGFMEHLMKSINWCLWISAGSG